MRSCVLQIRGTDGRVHTLSLQAESIEAAVRQVIRTWRPFSWFDSEERVLVMHNSGRWFVSQESVQQKSASCRRVKIVSY